MFVLCALFPACTYRSFDEPNSNANSNSTKELTEFEREIKSLKTADFDYIFAFKRKDGEAFTSEDKKFIKDNSHYATNRFTLAKDEKTIFAGSNFEFSEDNMKALRERFEVEDYSKPPEVLEKIKKEKEAAEAKAKEKKKE